MQRPLLLIVDGESLRTRGLERALVTDGWDMDWTTNQQLRAPQADATQPSLLLVDPVLGGAFAMNAISGFCLQHPGTPVVVVQDGPRGPGDPPLPPGSGLLPRGLPEDQWPSFLRGYLSRATPEEKLTSEDLFGDILAEIDRPKSEPSPAATVKLQAASQRPAFTAPFPHRIAPTVPAPMVPGPVKPVVVQMPLSRPTVSHGSLTPKAPSPTTTTIQTPLLRTPLIRRSASPKVAPPAVPSLRTMPMAPAKVMEPPAPVLEPQAPRLPPTIPAEPVEILQDILPPEFTELDTGSASFTSKAPSPILPELFGDLLGPLGESSDVHSAAKENAEFTLSGFSGIHDPFEASPKEVPEPEDMPSQGGLDIEFLTTNETTPANRPPKQPAASLVLQPPPAPLAHGDLEMRLDSGESPLEEFGNYYLLEKIAVGGMAELFKARQRGVHNFEKIVAIKRILPHLSDNDEFVRMFIDEAKLAAQLTHPNIVQIFDLGKASGFYYIAMEYVDGKDLRSLLRKVREYRLPMPEPVAAYVVMKVATALDYAHRKRGMNDKELKLVHRDVSPQNVLISSDGAVKLVDFGIAKAATKSTQTMAGALKGKLLYMSPEQALGQSLDNRSDIYSLGLVLFELLTGERCFQADSELGVLEKVRLGKVQDIQVVNPAVSKDLAEILQKTLQKNVDQRYPSARLMERDLKALLVRHGNEPTDHDVAEYVNTLLKGTKEQLEHLLAEHFSARPPAPDSHTTSIPTVPSKSLEDPPTRVDVKKAMSVAIPLPPPEIGEQANAKRRPWLVPIILLALALAGVSIWLLIR